MRTRTPPLVRKLDGREFILSTTRVSKGTAQKEAQKLRRHSLLARVVREPDGKYCVYSGSVPAKYYRRK